MAREKAPFILSILIHAVVLGTLALVVAGQPHNNPGAVSVHFIYSPAPRVDRTETRAHPQTETTKIAAPSGKAGSAPETTADSQQNFSPEPAPGNPETLQRLPGSQELPATAPMTEADFAAKVAAAIEAKKTYPPLARRRGTEGTVRLKLQVSPEGSLNSATVTESSGSALLDHAALDLAASVFPLEGSPARGAEVLLAVEYSLKD